MTAGDRTGWLGISDSNFDVQREYSSLLTCGNIRIFLSRRRPSRRPRKIIFCARLDCSLPERTLVKRRGQCFRFITSEFESSHGTRTAASIRIPRHRDSVPASSFVRSRNDRAAPKRARGLLAFHSTLSANRASVVANGGPTFGHSRWQLKVPLPRQRRSASAGLRWCGALVRPDPERN
jgi:hypothetical protein